MSSDSRHRLLARQLRKAGIDPSDGATPEQLQALIDGVDRSYEQADRERYLLERSLMLSSQEMQELYENLRRNSETAIAAERDQLQAVLQSLGDGLCIVDRRGQLASANPAARAMLGLGQADVNGLYLDRFCTVLHGDGEPVDWRHVEKVGHIREELGQILLESGEALWVSFVINGVQQRSGLRAMVLVFRDISGRLEAEARERTLRTQLARSARMESLGLLAGGVAHDLNNILGPVVAYPGIMLQDLPPDSPLRGDLAAISESAHRAVAVIQDLLMLAGRGAYNQAPLQLGDVVESYLRGVGFHQLQAQHPGITLETKLDALAPDVTGSWARISQALMNLIINAYEAVGDEGWISIRTGVRTFESLHEGFDRIPAGRWVYLEVADDGPGIARHDLEHVFDPFYTKKKLGRSGTGLGLAVVWGVIKDANGYVDVQTGQGGTSFTLYLSPSEAEATEQERPPSEPQPSLREHILVVDDSAEQRTVARRILSRLGYTIDTVEGGREAIGFLEKNKPDLMLLDMVMEEDFDGLDTFRVARKMHPNLPAVIVTGFSDTDRVRGCLQLGAGAVVQKPYTVQELAKAVRDELDRSQ